MGEWQRRRGGQKQLKNPIVKLWNIPKWEGSTGIIDSSSWPCRDSLCRREGKFRIPRTLNSSSSFPAAFPGLGRSKGCIFWGKSREYSPSPASLCSHSFPGTPGASLVMLAGGKGRDEFSIPLQPGMEKCSRGSCSGKPLTMKILTSKSSPFLL